MYFISYLQPYALIVNALIVNALIVIISCNYSLHLSTVQPHFPEMKWLGAALAAGLAKGVWKGIPHFPMSQTSFVPSANLSGRSPMTHDSPYM